MKVNGFTNRATWLVNLHFGDLLQEDIQDLYDNGVWEDENKDELTESIKIHIDDFVNARIEEQTDGLSTFITDMIPNDEIDFWELAELYSSDIGTNE